MFSTLTVTTAAAESNLTTLEQLKADLQLDDTQDTFLERVIEVCSDEISVYMGRLRSETDNVSLGLETLTEVFYDLGVPDFINLGRRPIGNITSVDEGGVTVARLAGNSDGAITATDNTFTSAGGPGSEDFTADFVGKTITVAGAGAAGATLTTTIASVTSATAVELTAAAGTTVSGATWTVENPAYIYLIKKPSGMLRKRTGNYLTTFAVEPVTVIYTAGWLMPGEAGRNLPKGIEDACIVYCRYKIDQLQQGEDFAGPLTATSIDGVGSFTFGSQQSRKGAGIPYEVRALLDAYVEPVFA